MSGPKVAYLQNEDYPDLTMIGSIEVEAIENGEGGAIHSIELLPPDEGDDNSSFETKVDTDALRNENTDSSILDGWAASLMGCVACETFNPKSALRKKIPCTDTSVKQTVSFGHLHISEFNMTLGDHPSATSGPPVALGWQRLGATREIHLDDYERARMPRRKRRHLKIPYRDRRALLEKDAGFSETEVNQAWAEALQIRKQRQETLQRGLFLMVIDDFCESASRKYQRMSDGITQGVCC
jgi:hypothetical protein